MTASPVTAILPYFGCKRTLAPRIVTELGHHVSYWEPFCGSLAVLMAKPGCSMETVNDLYGDVVNLVRMIQHPYEGPRMYRRLRRVHMCDVLYNEACDRLSGPFEFGPDRAFDFFVASWMGRNGVVGAKSAGKTFCVRYTKNGGNAAKRWSSAVDSIPAWRRRLRNVTVLQRDAFLLLERVEDAPGTAIYCDPPYIKKGAKYHHDFAEIDHERLAFALSRFTKTRVVVSYYEHPSLERMYPPDRWRHDLVVMSKAMAHQGGRIGTDVRAREMIITNDAKLHPLLSRR